MRTSLECAVCAMLVVHWWLGDGFDEVVHDIFDIGTVGQDVAHVFE
ncbi:hypothetical protein NSPZN2_11594 [Nitrospira defluvii]|uniref:Transposase n=1 Tax=Nitrospira defluvii TaxID=330214 RepID=A0ABM8QW71_9BACT|nr:hypothetical protein NSPZN2_11594 [Nitrospira defluvii]